MPLTTGKTEGKRNRTIATMADKKTCPICGGLMDKHGCCPKCGVCMLKRR